MTSTRLSALIIPAFCALLLAGCEQDSAQQTASAPSHAAAQAPTVTVEKPRIQTAAIYKDFAGRFEASESIDIRARVSGYLTKASFTEGSTVKKGDLLFIIDQRPFNVAYKQAQAGLKVAEANAALASANYERAKQLFETGDISAQLRDQRLQERDSAAASLDQAKAIAQNARLNLSYTRITAPITGRIGAKLVSEGNYVSGGTGNGTALANIVALAPIYFYFDIDEQSYLAYMRKNPQADAKTPNVPVMLSLGDEGNFEHTGILDFVDNTISEQTGTMRARASFTNESNLFTPGMFGRIRVETSTLQNAITIPDSAIITDQSRKYVYTVAADGSVSTQNITQGALFEGRRIITEGLTGDEQIIVNGLQRAHEGGKVNAQTADQTAQPTGK